MKRLVSLYLALCIITLIMLSVSGCNMVGGGTGGSDEGYLTRRIYITEEKDRYEDEISVLITESQLLLDICNTLRGLSVRKMKTEGDFITESRPKNDTYRLTFCDSKAIPIGTLGVGADPNALCYDGVFYQVVLFDINKYFADVYSKAVQLEDLSAASAVEQGSLIPRESEGLEFWIGDYVGDLDFSAYTKKYGLIGGTEYYGTGYTPSVNEFGVQVDPEHCVTYTVSAFPDESSTTNHITYIHITDPSVDVFGFTLMSSVDQVSEILSSKGFDVSTLGSGIVANKDNYRISFSCKEIRIMLFSTNEQGIVY